MKFKTSTIELKKAMQVLSPIVNHTHPTLAFRYFYLRPYGDQIEIKAYDDFTVGSVFVNVYDLEDDEINGYVQAKQLLGLVNSFTGDEVEVSITSKQCRVICGKSKYTVNLLESEIAKDALAKYEVDYYQDIKGDKIKIEDFTLGYSSVSHCLLKDGSQRSLQNVYLGDGRMLACDGTKGAVVDFPSTIKGILVHKTLCDCLSGAKSAEATLCVSDNTLYGVAGNFRFATSVSDDYPYEDIKGMIDKFDEAEALMELSADEVGDKLSRLLMFSDPDTNGIAFELDEKIVMSVDGQVAEETVEICKNCKEEPFSIAVDGKSLKEALSKTTLDVVWHAKSSEDIQYLYDGVLLQFFLGLNE